MAKLAVSGKMCSGKTTVSNLIMSIYPYFSRVVIAEPLKELAQACTLDGVARDTVVGRILLRLFDGRPSLGVSALRAFEERRSQNTDVFDKGEKPRRFLQDLGTDFRALDPDVWVRDAVNRSGSRIHLICDDLRFGNEAGAFMRAGWKLIRCVIPEEQRLLRVEEVYGDYPQELLEHASEVGLDHWDRWDYQLDTSVPLKEQEGKVIEMMEVFV
jgi:hypothetical protein